MASFEKCANCGACYQLCPVGAITLDTQGLYYLPVVDQDKCIDCGACVQRCPVNTPVQTQNLRCALGGFHKDKQVVAQSSSGGAFYAIAQQILSCGGVVFGAAFSQDCRQVVFTDTDHVPLERLQKSKYVESRVDGVFSAVKENLAAGRQVLFSGTPCQVAGLKRFLGKEYENLLTCDFSCGGLPSHQIYEQYLSGLEAKYKARVQNVDFRPKIFGWSMHAIKIEFSNGKKYQRSSLLDPYFRMFIHERLSVRDYCYMCDFADNHASDLVLADFWMHNKISSLANDEAGMSLIVANSAKGESVLKELEGSFEFERLDLKAACYNMKPVRLDPVLFERHGVFVKAVREKGFVCAEKELPKLPFKSVLKQKIKEIVFGVRNKW